jgi:hypothetical protein
MTACLDPQALDRLVKLLGMLGSAHAGAAAARHAVNSGRHRLADRRDDCYETPPEAVRALLKVEPLPESIWEPCCGPGAIVSVLREAGHRVYASDLVDYGCPDSESRIDFLLESKLPDPAIDTILTNPPYRLGAEFVRHALSLCPHVIILARLAFLESRRRSDLFDRGLLKRVHIFAERLPMMHRHGWKGARCTSNAIPFAWFVFDRDYRGPITLSRLSWKSLP